MVIESVFWFSQDSQTDEYLTGDPSGRGDPGAVPPFPPPPPRMHGMTHSPFKARAKLATYGLFMCEN